MNIITLIREHLAPVLARFVPDESARAEYLGMIKVSANPDHGDYQANFAMPLKKLLGKNPQEIAREIIAATPASPMIDSLAVAGPGFINIKLQDSWIAEQVQALLTNDRLGVAPVSTPKTFVVDYSGPNVAKPLHVGHLRSTIIGDALVRILRFLGHTVIGDNHLGDWGTQFGILIHGYKNFLDREAYERDPVRELARLYIEIKKMAKIEGDEDEAVSSSIMDACRTETAKLHAGDPENVALWHQFMPHCLDMLKPIYHRLDVVIDHALGESFYNPMLPGVVSDLQAKGIAVESNGALVVPNAKGIIPTAEQKDTEEPPALVRKRDGAFTYTTTDLATIQYRLATWKPDVLLYVVDARQALHFRTLFANARRWLGVECEMLHLSFGSVLGEDRKPFAARKGGAPELTELLDEAAARGLANYEASHAERKAHGHDVPELTDHTKREIAEAVGFGAVKYADLSGNRTSDYIFSYDKMLATEGNTATYMQYAYARCRAVLRKSGQDETTLAVPGSVVLLGERLERQLGLQLLKFEEVLGDVVSKYEPHHIAAYLWDLAKAFSSFYDQCPVLTAPSEELKQSRLNLVLLTGRMIKLALGLLGIRTVERM